MRSPCRATPLQACPQASLKHQPLTLVKEVDKSSPLLWTALVIGENLVTCDLRFWADSREANPPEVHYYTIALTNARIVSVRESMLDNLDPSKAALSLREEVTFTYQKISWTWTDSAISATDDWASPLV